MKVAILAVLACVAISGQAASVPHVVDYEAVRANIRLLRDGIREAIDQIRAIAVADNVIVGGRIGGKLSETARQAYAIIGVLENGAIEATLTQEQASLAFDQLKVVLAAAQTAVEADVALLSAGAQENIKLVFRSALANAEATGQEIVKQLGQ